MYENIQIERLKKWGLLNFYRLTENEILEKLSSNFEMGLSKQQALELLA